MADGTPTPEAGDDITKPPVDSGDDTPHTAPSYVFDPKSGLWFDPETGKAPPQWVQDQLNSSQASSTDGQANFAPLIEDLARLGLIPKSFAQMAPIADAAATVAAGGGGAGGGGGGDPYAGAANARAERALAENIRQNRIQEAMNAIDLQTMRQRASLAGAQFAAPTDTGGYFSQMGPESPIVKMGLADPMKFTPTPYNANISDEQIAKDLAMIRSRAGVGG